jgi:pimeloyl-ACP methyl ester carboxylesterase
MLDRRQWNPQQPLTDHFTVIRYDTRWHGQSAGADSAFLAADDLAEILDAAGVGRASIVGLSNGARIAVDFALAYPSRVERLVLASPGLGGYRPAQQADFWAPMMEALEEGDVTQAAVLLADSPVMHVEASDTAWVRAMVRDQAGVFSQDPRRELSSLPPAIRMLEMIRAPTLVISGESDLRDIVWTADTLEQGIVGSQRLIVPGARHLLNITHAEQFNRAVIEFLVGRPR